MSGVRDFNIDFSVADAPPSRREKKTPVSAINVEELIDPKNELPLQTRESVKAATSYVRRFADDAEGNEYGQKFADRLVQARELGPDSPEFQGTANQVDDLVLSWKRSNPVAMNDRELRWIRARVIDNMLGTGAIEPLRRDPRVTEILVRAHEPHLVRTVDGERMSGGCVTEIYGVGLVDAPGVIFGDDQEVLDFISRIHPDGKRPTPTNPNMSASLPDGSRLEAAHPCVTDGKSTFVALRRHPEEAHTLKNLIEWGTLSEELAIELASLVRARLNLVVAGGTSSGKALDINTPIPTPGGFIPMGEVKVGDTVFSEKGLPCTVVGAYDTQLKRKCFEVTFADGSTIIADADHLWSAKFSKEKAHRPHRREEPFLLHRFPVLQKHMKFKCRRVRKTVEKACDGMSKVRTVTTVDMLEALRGGYCCSIPVTKPVIFNDRALPVDPFVFGLWFATGEKRNSTVDVSNVPSGPAALTRRGVRFRKQSQSPKRFTVLGLQSDLKSAGLTSAHDQIPVPYLFCGIDQRHEMLWGMLCGTGFVARNNVMLVRTEDPRLVDALRSLTASLGQFITVREEGQGTFSVSVPMQTFETRWGPDHLYKRVVRIQVVDSRPVRCIAVSSDSRLFLAGTEFNTTHNTTTLNALVPFLPDHVHLSIIEDTPEMKDPPNLRLVSRRISRPGSGDVDDVTIRSHIRSALRSRPDVIIIGEVRGPEAVDALTAMNTGHEGSMVTCHANSAHETVVRLESMMSEAGEISEAAATHKIASSIDIIIHQARLADGRRRITGVYEVDKPALDTTKKVENVVLHPLWTLNEAARVCGVDRETGSYIKHADVSDSLLETRNVAEMHAITSDEISEVHHVTRRGPSSAISQD